MKRFFTFLMAVWALLSISQTVKADYVTVYFQCPNDWSTTVHAYAYNTDTDKNSNWDDAPAGSEITTSNGVKLWKCTFDSKYKYVIFKGPGKNDVKQYPGQNEKGLEVKDNYVYTSTSRNGTSLSDFEKTDPYTYTLIGGYGNGSWTSEPSSFNYDGDGKYTYTFTAAQDGEFRFRVNTNYTSGAALCPNVDVKTKRKELTSTPEDVAYNDQNDASGTSMSDNYWFCDVTKGKKYTFTLTEQYNSTNDSYTRKLSVVTKVIKLLNGTSELTGSNGSYTLDLSGETSSDAKITLTINDAKYGLATAQTISAVGTTNVDFVANALAALTLTKGFIYSLSVTEDGKMTVVAEEKVDPYTVYDAGFYLVGDFMSQYNDKTVNPGGDTPGKINYGRLYFKFEQQKDGSYKIDIPACLTAKMQILGLSVDGVPRVYGPSGKVELYGSKVTGTANPQTNGYVGGNESDNLVAVEGFDDSNNYWNLVTRNDGLTDDDGSYEVSFKYDPKTQSPTTWTIKHDGCKRVAYLLSTAKGATAQPLYNKRESVGADYDDNLKAAIHFDGSNSYYVLGTVVRNMSTTEIKTQAQKANDGIHYMGNGYGTHNKLFFLGSEPKENVQSSNKLYGNQPAVVLPKIKGTKIIEVNPTRGNDTDAMKDKSYGLQADFQIPGTLNEVDYPDAISMVGPAIPSTTTTVDGTTKWLWEATASDMTYDESDRCYKLVLNTSAESFKKTFRFVGDHDIAMNWYEDTTPANDKYPTKVEGTSDATVEDPNYVDYTSVCTEKTIDHNKDIIWNRGAGLWTVRFYIDVDNANKRTFRYTITGASKIYIPVTAHMGKLLRTYTSAVDVVPVDKEVLIYAAQSYTKNNVNNTGSGDETGTVKLYRLKFIPANQGVVLYAPTTLGNEEPGQIEVVPAYSATVKRYSSDVFDYVKDWAKPETRKELIWVNQETHEQKKDVWNNYLVPVLTDTKITQFYFDDQNKWTGRNFAFTRYSQTNTGRANKVIKDDATNEDPAKRDYFSFFRGAGTVKASYSYLMLPRTIMEGNGQILDQSQDNDTKLFSKSMVWFEGIDAPMDNETTGISELKNHVSNTDAAYYTLQGVKVAKPVKGIYIHQGKKVIVK
ncbi:MAG: hypothetical protein SOX60_08495 [Prevotella sp.]|nr:hypothetical protein [Prevotella sp.]